MGHFAVESDRIRIEQLEFEARIGVTEEERSKPQRLILNLTVWPKAGFEQMKDDIARAVDYVDLCRTSRQFVQERPFKLIETLASDLASTLLGAFPLQTVEVEVRKFVLPNTQYVSATAQRSAIG
jgi:7,8-dihydroneopterin aldolase/epimerase/oxygenase